MNGLLVAMVLGAAAITAGCREAKTVAASEPGAESAAPDVPQRGAQEKLVYSRTTDGKAAASGSRSPAEPARPEGSLGTPEAAQDVNPYTAPAFRAVSQIRLGRGSEPSGQVPDSQQTDVFMSYDPIHVSLTRPPSGSAVQLAIYEEGSNQSAWSDSQGVSSSEFVRFKLGPGDLRPGRYRAVVTIDGKSVGSRNFEVSRGDA